MRRHAGDGRSQSEVNREEAYGVWPVDMQVPQDRRETRCSPGGRTFIEEVWTDLKHRSAYSVGLASCLPRR